MDQLRTLIEKLEEKTARFLEYEIVTQTMLDQDWEEVGISLDYRQELMEKIDAINHSLEILTKDDELLRKILKHQIGDNELMAEQESVIEASQATDEVIKRIVKLESLIEGRLIEARNKAAEGIRAGHQTPKILKYGDSLKPNEIEGSLLKGSNRKA